MFLYKYFVIPLFVGLFAVQVNWQSANRDAVLIKAPTDDARIRQCVEGGQELRFRFETKLCKRRSFWYDGCWDERVEIKKIQYDPIKEEYAVISDVLHDTNTPKEIIVNNSSEAIQTGASLEAISVNSLDGYADLLKSNRQRAYLGIRIATECHGSGGFFTIVPAILSLGLIDTDIYNSGWTAFDLN